MPELPEIEIIKKNLINFCLNKKIIKIEIYTKKLRYKIPKIIKRIKNKKITKINRYSKYLIIKIYKLYLLIHLGISGNILITKKNILQKNDHIKIILENKKIIKYNDPRKFGYILLYKSTKKIQKIIKKLGPEPLTKKFNWKYLYKKIKKRKSCIHNLIMDNKIVSGIGNIYSNEILFISKIKPYRKSNSLHLNEIKRIVLNIKKILKKSLFYQGTLIRNHKNINLNYGFFKNFLTVYRKLNQPCIICKSKIKKKKKYGRSLYFCKKCQI